MELAKLYRLINLSSFDVCHEKCVYDPFRHVYRSGKLRLLKTVLSSSCSYDCLYCHNAWNRGVSSSPEEITKLFFLMRDKGLVNGAFLSNSIRDPEKSMEEILLAGEAIRKGFGGYLHLKIIPGCNKDQVRRAIELANRVSLNIESPSRSLLEEMCTTKSRSDFARTLRFALRYARRNGVSFTTQLIAGLGENDSQILKVAGRLYEMGVRRVYYSAFRPVSGTPLESRRPESKRRVTNLYRADALIRVYGFSPSRLEEIMADGHLPEDDPKIVMALKKLERSERLSPIEIPGIGVKAASLIEDSADLSALKRAGFSVKRASAFHPLQRRIGDYIS
ncbi:radical SAM protein [Geoglobus sp.]